MSESRLKFSTIGVRLYSALEFAEKLTFLSQTAGNGFASGCVLSPTRPDAHTPKVGFEKSQKFVNFWIFPHPHYLNSVQKVFKNLGNVQKILPPAKKHLPQNTTQLHFDVFW